MEPSAPSEEHSRTKEQAARRPEAPAEQMLSEPPGGWRGLAKLAARQRVAGAVYNQAARHEGLLPTELVRELGRAAAFDALICDAWVSDIGELLAALSVSRVPAIVTKGWALTATVFDHDTSLRPSGDVDVLVNRRHIGSARKRLAELGYRQMSTEPWPGFNERYKYAAVFRRPDAGSTSLEVELHWGLLDVPFFDRIPIAGWFDRASPMALAGATALAPAPEDHFVYLCGHLGLHHHYDEALFRYHDMAALVTHSWGTTWGTTHSSGTVEDGQQHGSAGTIREATDSPADVENQNAQGAAVPVRRSFDWDAVLERSAQWRLVVPVGETLARLADLWPEVVPREILERAAAAEPTEAERRVHAWTAERPRTPTSDFALALTTMPGVGRRIRFVMEQAVPSPGYMRDRYPLRWPALWPLAYVVRAWRGLKWAARKRARSRR